MKKFLNTLWEFIGEEEDKDNFIQKALKVCKVFKVKPLKKAKPDVPSKKTAYNLFCKDIRKTKKELQGVPVSRKSVIISKEWKKTKASEKKLKKYKDLYEEEKRRHEEALQRYQEDHTDEMEIINLHKRCNKKARKTLRSKKVTEPGLDDSAIEEEQKWSSDEKKSVTKAGKKVKKISQSKKAPKSPEFIDSSGDEQEGPPKDNKESPLLGVKEEAQSCFDLRKDSKNLTIEKEVERVVFMRGPYKGQEWSNVALCDTEYLKKALKRSDLDKKIKDLIKQALAKT